jgi:hypothetical protein
MRELPHFGGRQSGLNDGPSDARTSFLVYRWLDWCSPSRVGSPVMKKLIATESTDRKTGVALGFYQSL